MRRVGVAKEEVDGERNEVVELIEEQERRQIRRDEQKKKQKKE